MELEPSETEFKPVPDPRPLVPEPLPVRLVAVADVRLPATAGLERDLDAFYVGILGFERIPGPWSYQADNFVLLFETVEGPINRENLRPLQVEVPSLRLAEQALIEREWTYSRQKGIAPGTEVLVLRDPAGNWLEVGEYRPI